MRSNCIFIVAYTRLRIDDIGNQTRKFALPHPVKITG
jgi:hypothetical protein